ncbi:DNA polymerase III subunit delta' [Weissella diestrammenae]|nr:DNA polymerase III subunit delta' [Weissella diestrammenae]
MIAEIKRQQPKLVEQFKQAVASKQLAHAFLFTGPKGHGQKMFAEWLAMRLMCEHVSEDGEPDGTCSQCLRIAKHEHPDVIEVEPDGQSIKIEQIRFLRDEFTKTAVEGDQKIFIISAADTMTDNAANGLLKFIEEPVGQQLAILIAENRQQVLPTIVSRTQVVDFYEQSPEAYRAALREMGYDASVIELVSQLTDSVTTASEWLVDDWLMSARMAMVDLVGKIVRLDSQAFLTVQTTLMPLATNKALNRIWLQLFAAAWRDILLLVNQENIVPYFPESKTWAQDAQRYSFEAILKVQENLLKAPQMLDMNISLQTTLETLVLQSQFELAGKI